jgi:hypothetical protein
LWTPAGADKRRPYNRTTFFGIARGGRGPNH